MSKLFIVCTIHSVVSFRQERGQLAPSVGLLLRNQWVQSLEWKASSSVSSVHLELINLEGTDVTRTCKRPRSVNQSFINLRWKVSARVLKLPDELIFSIRGQLRGVNQIIYCIILWWIKRKIEVDGLKAWCYRAIEATAAWTQKLILCVGYCYQTIAKPTDRLFKVRCNYLDYYSFLGFLLLFTSLKNQGDCVCEREISWLVFVGT